jgi:hypothetical protein
MLEVLLNCQRRGGTSARRQPGHFVQGRAGVRLTSAMVCARPRADLCRSLLVNLGQPRLEMCDGMAGTSLSQKWHTSSHCELTVNWRGYILKDT